MTTLAEEGFLSDEVGAVVASVRADYAPWLHEIRALNAALVRVQYELRNDRENPQQVACATLYVRALAHAQAAVLLVERGMAASARAMIRCSLEALFALGACSRDPKVAPSWLDTYHVERLNAFKKLGNVRDAGARAVLGEAEAQRIRAESQRNIDELAARKIPALELAQRADLEDLYYTAYVFLCGAVHSSVADVDEHLARDPEGRISALITEPVVERLDGLLLAIGESMVSMARAMSLVFRVSVAEACEMHAEELKALARRVGLI